MMTPKNFVSEILEHCKDGLELCTIDAAKHRREPHTASFVGGWLPSGWWLVVRSGRDDNGTWCQASAIHSHSRVEKGAKAPTVKQAIADVRARVAKVEPS